MISRMIRPRDLNHRIAAMASSVAWWVASWVQVQRVPAVARAVAPRMAYRRFARIERVWRSWPKLVLAALACSLASASVTVQADTFTYSPVQSTARPFGLDVVDKVGLAGSDAASADFQSNVLPSMRSLIEKYLPEKKAIGNLSNTGPLVALDPSKLTLAAAADIRVYFVGEGASYRNSLGFNTAGGGVDSGDPLLIFPDASSPVSYLNPKATGSRSQTAPLMPGDFVNLGTFAKGTSLDFFLIANGAAGGTQVFSTDPTVNKDKIAHVVAFNDVENPYLLIGFEDLYGGGDKDYNDVLIAVYLGEKNVNYIVRTAALYGLPAPEPGFIWLIVAASGGWLYRARRRLHPVILTAKSYREP